MKCKIYSIAVLNLFTSFHRILREFIAIYSLKMHLCSTIILHQNNYIINTDLMILKNMYHLASFEKFYIDCSAYNFVYYT